MGSGGERRAGISSPKHLEVGGGCYYRAVLEKAAFPSTCAEQPLAPAPSCPACEGEAALRLSALQLQTGRVELLGRGELPAKVCKKNLQPSAKYQECRDSWRASPGGAETAKSSSCSEMCPWDKASSCPARWSP